MTARQPAALLCLVVLAATGPVPIAAAQDSTPSTTAIPPINPGVDELDGGTVPGAAPGGTTPAPADAPRPEVSGTTRGPGGGAPAAAGPTPTPPPYLAPGEGASVQPVASVQSITEPEIPLEPLRTAAVIAAVLAALLMAAAAIARGLGLRDAAAPVLPTSTGSGPFSRAREKATTLADDVRDFLRHSR